MAGHSKWKQIKHKKEITDKKRSKLFSKLLNAIAIAAKTEPNPQFNPRLRTAVETAKENSVPQENITRAIRRASESENLVALTLECYGPGGTQVLIEVITDSRNRAVAEIKKIIHDRDAKWAEPGSVLWAFEKEGEGWQAKFPQSIPDDVRVKIDELVEALEEHGDVQEIYTNITRI